VNWFVWSVEANLDQHVLITSPAKKQKYGDDEESDNPKVKQSISDAEVKERMDFASLFLLLMFVWIVCSGSIDDIMETQTIMTWFEEWVFYFELVRGRTILREVDTKRKYGLD
jgi:hypothetical protein